jgi:hypothetical protein
LRIVNVDASDHEVTNFNTGVYITHLGWSPDGTQLVFDAGPQAVGPLNFPYLVAIPASDALYTINTNGTGLKQLRAAPATWPAWSSGLPVSAPPRLALGPAPSGKQLIISWPTANGGWVLESSAQLGALANWQAVTTQQVVTNGQQTLTLGASTGTMFFRLRSP